MSGTNGGAYDELVGRYARLENVGAGLELLGWDQEVMMPAGGTPARARQLSALSGILHELLVHPRMVELLKDVEGADLGPDQAANVREIRRQVTRAVNVPTELEEEISRTSSEALPLWREAREANDYARFAPTLEHLVDLKRQYAEHVDPSKDPYEVLFEDYEPYLGIGTAETTLGKLRDGLVPLLEDIRGSGVTLGAAAEGPFPPADQMALGEDLLDLLGYDRKHGRLDTSAHPFTSGTSFDARITTRFDPDDALSSVFSVVHEFGHAFYELGLPRDAYGTPLGESRDLTVHESQSRFWENHVGRTRAFWELAQPIMAKHLPAFGKASPEAIFREANRVKADNLIRVEADELTYHLHIILRFEVERALLRGDLEVNEIPQVWDDKMEAYLGVRPPGVGTGCLQDIHWAHGGFGYFPTYSLGSTLSAQLDAALRRDVDDVDGRVRAGDFAPIATWLREHVHRHGQRYPTGELVRQATGRDLSPDAILAYADAKFRGLYDV